jgi:hypothetical protein
VIRPASSASIGSPRYPFSVATPLKMRRHRSGSRYCRNRSCRWLGHVSHSAGSCPGATSSMRVEGFPHSAHGGAATIASAVWAWILAPCSPSQARARGSSPLFLTVEESRKATKAAQETVTAVEALPGVAQDTATSSQAAANAARQTVETATAAHRADERDRSVRRLREIAELVERTFEKAGKEPENPSSQICRKHGGVNSTSMLNTGGQ